MHTQAGGNIDAAGNHKNRGAYWAVKLLADRFRRNGGSGAAFHHCHVLGVSK